MEKTKIEWCDHTVNFWWGCTKVSPGCKNCYADSLSKRFRRDIWGVGKPRESHLRGAKKLAMKLNSQAFLNTFCSQQIKAIVDEAEENKINPEQIVKITQPVHRPRVFSNSMSDWLDEEVPIEWLAHMLDVIRTTPHLDWLLLTKRPENWRGRIMDAEAFARISNRDELARWIGLWRLSREMGGALPPANVWIGTTVEDNLRAIQRIPKLLDIPARLRFLSCEPMLEDIDLLYACFNGTDSFGSMPGIDWVICGGESGSNCRPFDPEWARSLRDQCRNHFAGLPFFMKQMGGKRKPFAPIPEDLQIQEFPKPIR